MNKSRKGLNIFHYIDSRNIHKCILWCLYCTFSFGWRFFHDISPFYSIHCTQGFLRPSLEKHSVSGCTFTLHADLFGILHAFDVLYLRSVLPLVPAVLDTDLPSRDMPTVRHFCSLQCWQRFRLVRSIRQFFWRGHEYAALLCWLLLKKPYRPERWTERRLVNPSTTQP